MIADSIFWSDSPPAPPPDVPRTRKELWQRYSQTGPGSVHENELVQQYLPLVKTVVGRLAVSLPSQVDVKDLYSAALLGLLNAIRRYNIASGVAFETYARLRIRGSVFDELRKLDWVPRSIHDKAKKVEETMRRLEQKNGALPTESEMAEALHMSVDEYLQLISEIKPASFVCLDAARGPYSDDETQYETVPDPNSPDPSQGVVQRELARLVAERLEHLPDVQRKVLALYYFEDLRLREIAEVMGVTESRICQIHGQALMAIKSYLKRHELKTATPQP